MQVSWENFSFGGCYKDVNPSVIWFLHYSTSISFFHICEYKLHSY